MTRVLIVENDTGVLAACADAFAGLAIPPTVVRDRAEASAAIASATADANGYAVVLVGMDAATAPGLIEQLRALDPELALVAMTADPGAILAGPNDATDRVICLPRAPHPMQLRQAVAALAARRAADRRHAALAVRITELEERQRELAAAESRAVHLAMHDPLTDAPNRLAFLNALAARAHAPGRFALAMIDLDRFKLVNDTLGHLAGDELIRQLCAILHRAAPPGALVARLGGDEFAMLFDTADDAAAIVAGERVVAACRASLGVFGHSVRSGASVGIVTGDASDATDATGLLRRADLALSHAKAAGRGTVRRFDATMDEGVRVRLRIEQELAAALTAGQLALAYQPIVGRDRLAVEGFEALVRWNSPEHGPISPSTFVPVAEDSNLIHELGDWIMGQALAAVRQWPGQFVSVNVSTRQFRRHGFANHLTAAAAQAGVPPHRVQLEITETAIFEDPERAANTLARLRSAGFRVALDEFGAGYSSLYNIRSFALDCLKIDRGFVSRMSHERESAAIVHSIIHLGRALGLSVVAEGVENAAQAQALRLAGASHFQGFYFSRAVDAAQAGAMANAVQAHSHAPAVRLAG